jgi:hypothetical protein
MYGKYYRVTKLEGKATKKAMGNEVDSKIMIFTTMKQSYINNVVSNGLTSISNKTLMKCWI